VSTHSVLTAGAELVAVVLVAHRPRDADRRQVVVEGGAVGDLGAEAFEGEVEHGLAHLLAHTLALVGETQPRP
jgi:hypothetical protein